MTQIAVTRHMEGGGGAPLIAHHNQAETTNVASPRIGDNKLNFRSTRKAVFGDDERGGRIGRESRMEKESRSKTWMSRK